MQFIPESELIINERGAIYHLDIHPDEMADTIITVGDPGRVAEVSKYFDRIEHRSFHREFNAHTGYIGSKKIMVVSTGMGPDNIDIALNELDALVNIDFKTRTSKAHPVPLTIIRIGTCGSLQADIPVDSFIASSYSLGIDNLMHFYPHVGGNEDLLTAFKQHAGLPETISPFLIPADKRLNTCFKDGFYQGITVTCPGFYAPQGRMLRLKPVFPALIDKLSSFRFGDHRICNFEMETSAIYGLGKLLGHQCVSLSAVVANRITNTFSKGAKPVVEKLILKALEEIILL